MNVDKQVVLSDGPKEFHEQGPMFCGAYSVNAILESFGEKSSDNLRTLYSSFPGRLMGLSIPSDMTKWQEVFASHGLQAEIGSAKERSPEERLQLLKSLLTGGNRIMIRIGNGYGLDGKYRKWQSKLVGHWHTLWGFDDSEKNFYVYDSAVRRRLYDRDIPIGNKKRTYDEVMRDWEGPIYPCYEPYQYIAVCSSS